jgi:hypothetical protein
MVLIILAAVGFLAGALFLFVLFQWTRDSKRKTAGPTAVDDPSGETSEKELLQTARASTEKQDRFSGRSRQLHRGRARSRGCGLGCDECERAAYEKVARSLRSGNRN